jgi:peptidoglycan/LPS O-acetylase OafA/YrhL
VNGDRLEYLDSLRGLAAVAVFCRHFTGAFGFLSALPAFVEKSPLAAYHDGAAAVSLFFVLSGFVLSLRVLSRESPAYDLRANVLPFAVARIARIWLPFVVILLASALAQRTLMPVAGGDAPASSAWLLGLWREPASAYDLLHQGMLVFQTGGEHVLPQDWTLTIEMNLSLLMPFLLLIASQSMAALVAFTVVAVGLLTVHNYLVAFVIGMGIARYSDVLVKRVPRAPLPARVALALGGVFFYSFRYSREMLPSFLQFPIRESWLVHINEIGAAIVIVTAMTSPALQRLLRHTFLAFMGRVSYSIYLLQLPVLIVFAPACIRWLNSVGLRDADSVRILAWVASMTVLLVLSWASCVWIELPSIALGKRVTARVPRL